MKLRLALPALALAAFCCITASAQAPAGAPAGTTGKCKDGTWSNAASKSGACSGHKGVAEWYAAAAAKPAAPAKAATPAAAPAAKPTPAAAPAPVAKPAPAPTPAAKTMPAPAATAAAGGGPGMVWVNTESKVYHCSGTRWYGKTKAGKYMTEAAAKAEGDKPDAGRACSK